jgi:hypothetical protein
MPETLPLADRLADAARAAVLNERPSIEHPAGGVRGITVELVLTSAGQLHEAVAYVERRSRGSALLERHTAKGPAAR